MLNIAIIQGRFTALPELKTTTTGKKVTTFTLACDRFGKEKKCDFIRCVAWEGTAEFVCRYFRQGDACVANGSLQVRNYEDKNGNKREAVELIVREMNFCGSKRTKEQEDTPDTFRTVKSDEQSDEFKEISDGGDLPF